MVNMVQSQNKYVQRAYGGGGVSSENTANLIANSIMHHKQKAMGIQEETPVEEEAKPFSMLIKKQTSSIGNHLGIKPKVKVHLPPPSHLPELSNAIAVKPIVSKDEIMEAQSIKPLSMADASAKDAAV